MVLRDIHAELEKSAAQFRGIQSPAFIDIQPDNFKAPGREFFEYAANRLVFDPRRNQMPLLRIRFKRADLHEFAERDSVDAALVELARFPHEIGIRQK